MGSLFINYTRVNLMIMRRLIFLSTLVFSLGSPAFANVDVNNADLATLEHFSDIGTTRAKEIIAERKKGGPFKDVADLGARVKSLDKSRLAKLQKQGLSVGPQNAPDPGQKVPGKNPPPLPGMGTDEVK